MTTPSVISPPRNALARPSSPLEEAISGAVTRERRIVASASRLIPAPPERVYAILSDYRNEHAAILPKPYFVSMHVEQGGVGEGTVVQVTMKVLGRWQDFRLEVTEPMPGEILRERDLASGSVTTFTLEPSRARKATRVSIETVWPRKPGLRGWLEGKTTAMMARRIYEKELGLLVQRAQVIASG